jgi:hypothetical protein
MNTRFQSKNGAPSPLLEPGSPNVEAVARLRLIAGVALIVELVFPLYEMIFATRVDWPAIELRAIWFVLTLALLVATGR